LVVHLHLYDERKKLESLGRKGMESIEDSMDPKVKKEHEKNMKIPRKKEKPEQPVITPRIIRLPAWFEPTRSSQAEEMEGSCDEEQCM
jgi:hypothetical protein